MTIDVLYSAKQALQAAAQPRGGSPLKLEMPTLFIEEMRAYIGNTQLTAKTAYTQYKQCAQLLLAAYHHVKTTSVHGAEWVLASPTPIWSADEGGPTWVPSGGATAELVQPLKLLRRPGGRKLAGVDTHHYVSVQSGDIGPDSSDCTVEIENESTKVAAGLVLFTTHTRTRLIAVTPLSDMNVSVQRRLQRGPGTAWQILFDHNGIAPGERVPLRLTFQGDPPHIRAVTWLVIDPSRAMPPPAEDFGPPVPAPPLVAFLASATELAEGLTNYERTWVEEMAERRALILAAGATHQAHKQFFYDLDERTSPNAPIDAEHAHGYSLLGGYLAAQYMARAEVLHIENSWNDSVLSDSVESWKEEAPPVADRVRDIFLHHYGLENGLLDEPRVRESFELFARGELAVLGTHGVPNGANYFCFAELALLMVELGHETAFWKPLLRIFTETAEVYVRSFHHCGAERTICSYRVEDPMPSPRAWSHPEWQSHLATWSPLTDEERIERYVRVVHAALYGEMNGPSEVPPLSVPDVGCPRRLLDWPLRHVKPRR